VPVGRGRNGAKRAINSTRSSKQSHLRAEMPAKANGLPAPRSIFHPQKGGKGEKRGEKEEGRCAANAGDDVATTTDLPPQNKPKVSVEATGPTSVLDSCLSPWSSDTVARFPKKIQMAPTRNDQGHKGPAVAAAQGVPPRQKTSFPLGRPRPRPRATIEAEMLHALPQSGSFR
jgi:hypothetical protein